MARPLLILLVVSLLLVSLCPAQAETGKGNLIPVRPQYLEATHVPQQAQGDAQAYPPGPTPAEQLYVFWILGKIISYPVDTLEAYVGKLREDWRAKPVPASAQVGPNPFEARNLGQIPPAPPVLSGSRGH